MTKPSHLLPTTMLSLLLATGISLAQDQPSTPAPAPKKPASSARSMPGSAKAGTSKTAANPAPLTTEKDRLSYALGADIGTKLKSQSVEVDPAIFNRGLKDALSGTKTALTEEEIRGAIMGLQTQMRQKAMAAAQALGDKNKKEGEEFLAANKTREGVVTLPSGLQYKILKAGEGNKPAATDTVSCNYRGTLIDGTEFDSSYKRGEPASFAVNGVIKGWTEALQLMPVGSKWQLFIPSDLAYGPRGAGGQIGPNSTLIFEVELISIAPKAESKDQPKDQSKD